jgi:rhodanese-related sulfurtransferase
MATPKQIAANRRNAQHSTGPKSAETKATVSQNSVRHGLCAQFRVLPEVEKQEEFDAFLNRLIEDEQPVGQAEIELVVKMAEHTWLAKRALRLQNNCFSLDPRTPEQTRRGEVPVGVEITFLEKYMRYHATHDRAYQRASAELQKRKKARELAAIGFASQKRQQAEEARKAEKHAVQIATAKLRKQREEIKLGDQIADILGPNFDPSSLEGALAGSSVAPAQACGGRKAA